MQSVIYSNGSQECDRIASLVRSLGGEFLEYRLNYDFTQRAFNQEFGEEATYPQCSIGNKHIWGMKETLQFFKSRKLI